MMQAKRKTALQLHSSDGGAGEEEVPTPRNKWRETQKLTCHLYPEQPPSPSIFFFSFLFHLNSIVPILRRGRPLFLATQVKGTSVFTWPIWNGPLFKDTHAGTRTTQQQPPPNPQPPPPLLRLTLLLMCFSAEWKCRARAIGFQAFSHACCVAWRFSWHIVLHSSVFYLLFLLMALFSHSLSG